MVNRELLTELINFTDFDIRIIQSEHDQYTPDSNSKYGDLLKLPRQPHAQAHLNIRHHWPPDFEKAQTGKLVVIFPWEYGSLPVTWRDQMIDNTNEIWVYSSYLKKCYELSGIPSSMVHIIPPGIDCSLFSPDTSEMPLFTNLKAGRFCFFFNGGVTLRKGTDILVNAYLNEFTAADNVCLIIKDSFSYGKELARKVQLLGSRTDIAAIKYILQNFNHEDLPRLYKSCDCYVHPCRAEGFGLPVAEALACEKPVITTGFGATSDFITQDSGYLIESTVEYMKEKNVSGYETVDTPFWAVPDMKHLQLLMRYVYEHYDEARKKAAVGRAGIKNQFSLKIMAEKAAERIHQLADTAF